MSRSPSEHTSAHAVGAGAGSRLRDAGLAWRRHWLRARNRLPQHLLYVRPQEVVGWRRDAPDCVETAASVSAWCATHSHSDIHLRVSGELVHNLVVDASLDLRGADAVRRYARQQFVHYHGAQAAAWPLAAWSDPGRGGQDGQAGACAVHGLDLELLQADARRHGVRVRSVAPVWPAGLRSLGRWLPRFEDRGHHALLLVEGDVATWLVAEGGRVVLLSQRFLDATRIDAVAALLVGLVDESPPLAGLPVVIGWGTESAAPVPPELALMPGPLGAPMMRDWLQDVLPAGSTPAGATPAGATPDRSAGKTA